jgi:hypothetical protein
MLKSPEAWNLQWEKWFLRYSQGNPRFGKWLSSRYAVSKATILEIGAGSGRESRFLSTEAKSVTCVDYSPSAVRLLANHKLPANMNVLNANAANLPFGDQYFDLTFHKGFWILFDSDAELELLLREQLRVSRKITLAAVQNGLNIKQVQDAGAKAEADPLFRFRFFIPSEIDSLARKVVSDLGIDAHIQILKYGAPSLSRTFSPLGVLGDKFVNKIYKFLPWSFVECVVLEITKK